MKLNIRQEKQSDYKIVEAIIEAAFRTEQHSDQTEHLLVERLRTSDAFIPELSLVAAYNSKVIGHILLTKIKIRNEANVFESLALAPVSVDPDFQSKGVGTVLIESAHQIAKDLGFKSIVLVGHQDYYPRFGYLRLSNYEIRLPFDVPEENSMILELIEGGLDGVSGLVEYAEAFMT